MVAPEEVERRIKAAVEKAKEEVENWDGKSGELYWISFATIHEFLHAAIILAPSHEAAQLLATARGLNPGDCSVAILPINKTAQPLIAEFWKNRKLDKAQCEQFDQEMRRIAQREMVNRVENRP